MIAGLRFGVVTLIFIRALVAQVSEAELKASYRSAEPGLFILAPGTGMKALFDTHGDACTLTLFGQLSEAEVFTWFDKLVPVKTRGVRKQGMLECVGFCQRSDEYQNVDIVTGTVAGQTSTPAALISFTRPECSTAMAEASKIVVKIERHETSKPFGK